MPRRGIYVKGDAGKGSSTTVHGAAWGSFMLPTERQEFEALMRVERSICDQLLTIRKRKRQLENAARCRHRHETKARGAEPRPSVADGLRLLAAE